MKNTLAGLQKGDIAVIIDPSNQSLPRRVIVSKVDLRQGHVTTQDSQFRISNGERVGQQRPAHVLVPLTLEIEEKLKSLFELQKRRDRLREKLQQAEEDLKNWVFDQ
jgi:hypothetical protein